VANIKRANALGITKTGVAISDVPDAPIIGAVSDLGTGSTASVAYTAATTGGAATTFTATSSPGGLTGTGSSPITVSGLTAGTAYTFTVTASNTTGSTASAASSSLTLAAVGVFESIASATGTGSAGNITFSSIPSTYKHLQIRFTYKDTSTTDWSATNAYVYYRFNSDSGTNYARHYLIGNGSTAIAGSETPGPAILVYGSYMSSNATYANMVGVGIIDIHDYASTTKNKTTRHIAGADANGSGTTNRTLTLSSALWTNTAAITSITLSPGDAAFATTSTFALYGIKG